MLRTHSLSLYPLNLSSLGTIIVYQKEMDLSIIEVRRYTSKTETILKEYRIQLLPLRPV